MDFNMRKLYCITCPAGCLLTVIGSGFDMVIEGNKCEKGREFAKHEMSNPSRTLTTTVRTKFPGVPVISVRTDGEIPRDKLMDAMKELSSVIVETELGCGDTVVEDIAKTGVRVIVTSFALMKLGAELENRNVELSRRGSSGDSGGNTASGMTGGFGSGLNNTGNTGVLNDIGPEAAGGFVGAAGEAVGVEDTYVEDESDEEAGEKEEGRMRISSRPHIKRK
jgi:CxxC motif-containing protein